MHTFPELDPTELWKHLFLRSPIGIAVVGLNGEWLRVNPALCDMLGYTEAELLKRDFQSVTYNDDIEPDVDTLHRLENQELDYYSMRKRYHTKSGDVIWINLTVHPHVHNNEVTYFFSHIQPMGKDEKWLAAEMEKQTVQITQFLSALQEAIDKKEQDQPSGFLALLKEHVHWIAPILITFIGYVLVLWRDAALQEQRLQQIENMVIQRNSSLAHPKKNP